MALEPPLEVDHLASHQTPSRTRDKRRHAQVISSIIASLDGPHSPITHASYTYVSASASASSHQAENDGLPSTIRPPLDHASTAPPRLKHSQSFGMDYGAYLSPRDEHDYDSDAAEYPVIPTARPRSGKSSRTAPSSASPSGLRDILRSASRTSLSPSGHEGLSRSNSRLSADSWVRGSPSSSRLSLDHATERLTRRLSRSLRYTSRDSVDSRQQDADHALLSPNLTSESADRQTSARSPRPRLYLEDVMEDVAAPDPDISVLSRNTDRSGPATPVARRNTDRSEASTSKSSPNALKDQVPQPSPTSIPPRTSSLNRTPSPTRSRLRKLGKGKRAMTTLKEERPPRKSKPKSKSKVRPDAAKDTFDGLDQDDQTVKRIKELRQQKEDRLRQESPPAVRKLSLHEDGVPRPKKPVRDPRASAIREFDWRDPPANNRAAARAPDLRKAHRMLGLDESAPPAHQKATPTVRPAPINIRSRPSVIHGSAHRDGALTTPDVSNLSSALAPDSPILGNAFSTPLRIQTSLRPFTSHAPGDSAQDSPTIGTRAVARKSTQSHSLDGLDIEGLDLSPPSTAHSHSTFQSRDRSVPTPRPSYDGRARRRSMNDARENRLLEDEVMRDRRNSASVAVNAYLNNPRLNQKVCHPQTGRIISFSEVGASDGAAVIVCVGMGLTRFVSAFYDDLASSLGLRLITPERPGVGASEPLRERDNIGPLGWSDDVLTITQHLGISQFGLIAHSAGATYALATALILPQHVRGRVQLLAPWIPPSQFENINQKDRSPDNVPMASLTRGQRFLRVLPVPFLRAANGGLFLTASLKPVSNGRANGADLSDNESPRGTLKRRGSKKPSDVLRRESLILMDQIIPDRPRDTMFPLPELCEEEKTGVETIRKPSFEMSATASPMDPAFTLAAEALNAAEHAARAHQAAYSTLLTERTWTLATRDSNPAVDLIVCLERHRDIGFRYVDVQRKVVITHGAEDKRVPVENIRWIGDQMNRYSARHINMKEKGDAAGGGGCEIRVLPGEGHGLMANPTVMADVLSEISYEWRSTKW